MKLSEWGRNCLLVGCYFLAHILLKAFLSDGVDLDDAEQFLWAQDFRLGYGAELPLYTWLQKCFFALFGTTIFAVALLKNLLLFAFYIFTFMGAREASGDERCGSAAMLTLFLIPQIIWESQRILTHMALATALAAMAFYFFLRIVNSGRLRYYLLFGCTAALGMLAKYNFGIFLLALLLSSLSLHPFRSRIAGRKSVAALVLFLLVIALPFSWIAFHPDLALAKGYKLHAGGGTVQAGPLTGLRSLLASAASFASAPILLYGAIFLRTRRVPERPDGGDCARLAGRTLLFGLIICLLLIFFCGVTQFRVRWLQPLLAPLPVFLSLLARSRLNDSAMRNLKAAAAGAAVTVLLLLNGRILFASHLKPFPPNEPYPALAEQISSRGFQNGLIIAESITLGGNLKPQFPSARIVSPDIQLSEPLAAPPWMPLLVVWYADETKEMPPELDRFLRERIGPLPRPSTPAYAEAPYRYMPGRTMQLGFVIMKPNGNVSATNNQFQ